MAGSISDMVDGIWRYPIKSMAGEPIGSTHVTARGLVGDRAYALVDKATNRAAESSGAGAPPCWAITCISAMSHRLARRRRRFGSPRPMGRELKAPKRTLKDNCPRPSIERFA